ncbi:MAG: shikimate kinase [Saprospiraceae bacterium]|jgi:shikimate kinase
MSLINQRIIFLIGFMGSGKSHTGKALAARMDCPFFDLDEYIEEKLSMSISAIFDQKGEDYFRIEERKCLRDFGVLGKAVIATGGGTSCFFDNMEWMKLHGVTVYLKASPSVLALRLENEKSKRPLIADFTEEALLDFIINKLKERSPFYEQASVVFEQTSPDEDIMEELFKHYLNITGH